MPWNGGLHENVHLHFTPTYSSWLNQVELRLSKIERDIIARRPLPVLMPLRGSAGSSRNGGHTLFLRRTLWRRRNSDRDSGAPAAGTDDLQGAADPDRSLVHRAQAQVSGKVPVGFEPHASSAISRSTES